MLLDAHVTGSYGGTGQTLNWDAITNWHDLLGATPLILAGGLTPANVASAIELVRPTAVDTAGGVEIRPGAKDECLVGEFVRAARKAFESLP
jgi:phosphoribosylanthranilate isomerase